jgi:23S rRNA (pseudouridine1915-N3)-methyltransferase
MSRRLLILWAGRHQRPAWDELCADYRQRIGREIAIQDQMVKVRGSGDDPGRLTAEGQALLDALPNPCLTVALDPRGDAWSSERLSSELARWRAEWPHAVAFVVGSDLGLAESVVQAARIRMSFGPMIFGHELARLVLYEQLYRALSMERGIKYHRRQF